MRSDQALLRQVDREGLPDRPVGPGREGQLPIGGPAPNALGPARGGPRLAASQPAQNPAALQVERDPGGDGLVDLVERRHRVVEFDPQRLRSELLLDPGDLWCDHLQGHGQRPRPVAPPPFDRHASGDHQQQRPERRQGRAGVPPGRGGRPPDTAGAGAPPGRRLPRWSAEQEHQPRPQSWPSCPSPSSLHRLRSLLIARHRSPLRGQGRRRYVRGRSTQCQACAVRLTGAANEQHGRFRPTRRRGRDRSSPGSFLLGFVTSVRRESCDRRSEHVSHGGLRLKSTRDKERR